MIEITGIKEIVKKEVFKVASEFLNYLIDVKGYSEEELIEQVQDGLDLGSLLSDEDWAEYEEWSK